MKTQEQIVRGGDLAAYFRLRRAGRRVAWAGEGKICFVQPDLSRPWERAEAAYKRGDRSWVACTGKFYRDMLGAVPPLGGPGCFGVGEPANRTGRGAAVYLWLKGTWAGAGEIASAACRLATMREIKSEN